MTLIIIIKFKVYHTKDYALNHNQTNCYTVELKDKNLDQFFGTIHNFVSIESEIFCIVNLFNIDYDNDIFKGVSATVSKHVDKFFLSVKNSTEFFLIKPKHIVRRCLIIENSYATILTPCVEIEHD